MNSPKQIWDKTAGYKTKSGALLILIFQLFQKVFPNTLSDNAEEAVLYSINILILTGGADWVWRNRHEIVEFIAKKFNYIKNGFKNE